MLEPAAVEFSAAEARLISDQLVVLGQLGFKVESFGLNTFLVRAVPHILSGIDPGAALRVLVEDFEEDETPLQSEQEAKIIARICSALQSREDRLFQWRSNGPYWTISKAANHRAHARTEDRP